MAKIGLAVSVLLIGLILAGCNVYASITIGPDQLPDGVVGQPYSATITATSSETVIGISIASGLPPGMAVAYVPTQNTAVLSGTPGAAGSYPFTVVADGNKFNSGGPHAERAYTLVVKP